MTGRRSRQRALQILGEPDAILPGEIVVRILPCDKANGRCEAERPELHGPHLQWSYTYENKRLTRWLSAEQDER